MYGEEATRKAQKEGEEAAAAYEQEKKDIAEGKVPPPLAKPEKKKQTKKEKKSQERSAAGDDKKDDSGEKIKPGRKRKLPLNNENSGGAKKAKPGPKPKDRSDKDVIQPVLAKAAIKVDSILSLHLGSVCCYFVPTPLRPHTSLASSVLGHDFRPTGAVCWQD